MENYLTQVELACLHLQEPEDLPIITVALWFGRELTVADLKSWLSDRMGRVARFRSRVAFDTIGQAYWKQCSSFRLDDHVDERSLSEDQLWDALAELHSQPLPLERPLWKAEVLQLQTRSVVAFRVHHAVADGLALMSLLSPDEEGHQRVALPRPRSLWERLGQLWKALCGALRLVFLPWDPPTRLKGEIGVAKRLAMTTPWSVSEMKQVAHRTHGTINDLLVAILAGALTKHLGQGAPELKVVIPVALRTSPVREMSNRFGLVFLPLPMRIESPAARLAEAKKRMDRLKVSGQAQAVFLAFNRRGLTPAWFDRWFTRVFAGKATTMMTNLRGPTKPLLLAGREVEDITFWATQVGHLALGVNVMSYRGQLRIGVGGDARVIDSPQELVEALEQSWEELRQ